MAKKIPQQFNNPNPVHNPGADAWPGPTGPSQPRQRVGGQSEANLIDNPPAADLKTALANSQKQVDSAGKSTNWKG
jgi:hypothetical protein